MKKRKETTRVIFHHSLSPDVSANEIRKWHNERGWSDIGYHFVVRKNGAIEVGRPFELVGAHKKGHNADSVGVCITGSLSDHPPTPAQYVGAKAIFNILETIYGDLGIEFHRGGDNPCPGALFDREGFIDLVRDCDM